MLHTNENYLNNVIYRENDDINKREQILNSIF